MQASILASDAAVYGLRLRGVFSPLPEDRVPPLADGRASVAVALLGNVGPSLWRAFSSSFEHRDGLAHPLDRWSRRVGTELGEKLGALPLYPFGGPPHLPFLGWAARAGAANPSPLGLSIDPTYGLWHAYRLGLAFAEPLEGLGPTREFDSPCLGCSAKPCLDACPVQAFDGAGYAVENCVEYLTTAAAQRCTETGCLARCACPVGAEYRYGPPQMRLHMEAFVGARVGLLADDN